MMEEEEEREEEEEDERGKNVRFDDGIGRNHDGRR